MNLYISREQYNSMRAEHCLRCGKMRSFAFYQVNPQYPVILSVDKNQWRDAVQIKEICECKSAEQLQAINEIAQLSQDLGMYE